MIRIVFTIITVFSSLLNGVSHAGIVIESTRYLYKEGDREISAQVENQDDIAYLIKSWIESPEGASPAFMVTPPLYRLEGKQKNTSRIFATPSLSAPADRETIFFFNVMAIPPTDESSADQNTVQLAVRHRMRLVYRPQTLFELSNDSEAKKIEWQKRGNKLTVKNPTPFFYYFRSIQLGNKEIKDQVNSIAPFTSKEVSLKGDSSASRITWSISNDYGGAGSIYSSQL